MTDKIFGGKRKVPVPVEPPSPKEEKPRKIRSDKKHNIKYPLSAEDKRQLGHLALEHEMKLTAFSNMIIENELKATHEYQEFEYDEKGVLVNACLTKSDFLEIQKLAIDGNVSYREVAFRLVKNYLSRVTEIRINTYRGLKITSYRSE